MNHEEGAAAVRRHRRHQVERSERISLDHGLAAQLPEPKAESTPNTSSRTARTPRSRILYQNDDYGKDYLKGLKDGLGAKAATMIVAEESYETTEPTIDSQIVKLKSTGADVFFNVTTPKFAAQAIKKDAEIEWKPLHFLNNVSASIGSVIQPAGFEPPRASYRPPISRIHRSAVEERCRHEGLRCVPRPNTFPKGTAPTPSSCTATLSPRTSCTC